MAENEKLRRTPLFETHKVLGGRLVAFSGWEMPVQYVSILAEAKAVRAGAGLFDVSHMGRVTIHGPGAGTFLNRILSIDVPRMQIGRARYNLICNHDGGIIDDCIVYRLSEDRFLLVPNATNTSVVLDWMEYWARKYEVQVEDITSDYAMVAHQGPRAASMLSNLTDEDLSSLRPFRTANVHVAGIDTFLARTGYTGEDGFELILKAEAAVDVWNHLTDMGAIPCGLGARDVLRLEAGLPLHGNDMDASTNPYEAGLDRFVDPNREGYVAQKALLSASDTGVARRLVGFEMVGRGIARQGYSIFNDTEIIGQVTSGSYSPTLDRNIGLGYVPTVCSKIGARLYIEIRGKAVKAKVTAIPFYSRRKGV